MTQYPDNTANPLADEFNGETINSTCSMVDTSGYDDFMDDVEEDWGGGSEALNGDGWNV